MKKLITLLFLIILTQTIGCNNTIDEYELTEENFLYYATVGDEKKVKLYLDAGIDINAIEPSMSRTALLLALVNNHHGVAFELLKRGASTNICDNDGDTALMYVLSLTNSSRGITEQQRELIRLLIENGANINSQNKQNKTPLMVSMWSGDEKVIEMLLSNGASVNAQDVQGRTALMEATYRGHTEIVKMLLDNSADVNTRDNYGTTALMFASAKGYVDIVEILLANCADTSLKDNHGHTALIKAGDNKLIRKLLITN